MKRQDLEKIRSKTLSELRKEMQQHKRKLVDSKMQATLGKLKNIREIKLKREDISQFATIIREKQIDLDIHRD